MGLGFGVGASSEPVPTSRVISGQRDPPRFSQPPHILGLGCLQEPYVLGSGSCSCQSLFPKSHSHPIFHEWTLPRPC